MQENNLINQNNPIDVLVDCTTSCDDFLIMMASIIINGKAVCLYFSSRVYPRRKNRVDYKIMERAFIKGLKQVLSKKYQLTGDLFKEELDLSSLAQGTYFLQVQTGDKLISRKIVLIK